MSGQCCKYLQPNEFTSETQESDASRIVECSIRVRMAGEISVLWGCLQVARLRGARYLAILALLGNVVWWPKPVWGQAPLNERVLVVYNSSASKSLAVAKYYMAQRGIPESNLCRIAVDSDDTVKQDEFESRVKTPIRKCLEKVGKQRYCTSSFRTARRMRLHFATVSRSINSRRTFGTSIRPGRQDMKLDLTPILQMPKVKGTCTQPSFR